MKLKKQQRLKEEEKKRPPLTPEFLFSHLPAAEARKVQHEQAARSRPVVKPNILSPRKMSVDDFSDIAL